MVKSSIKSLMVAVGVFSLGGLATLGVILKTSSDPLNSAFTHEEIEKINPVLIVDAYTLSSPGNFKATLQDSLSRMVRKGALVMTPFGPIINPNLKQSNYSISIMIQSGGGKVSLGLDLVEALNSLRQAGIKLNCYVGEAQSMAFTLMVTSCDKVIAKKDAILMQHRVSYRSLSQTPSTFQLDIEMSRRESEALKVGYKEWHKLVRGPEDHVFTEDEIKKYKLVDEWID